MKLYQYGTKSSTELAKNVNFKTVLQFLILILDWKYFLEILFLSLLSFQKMYTFVGFKPKSDMGEKSEELCLKLCLIPQVD